MSENRFQEIYGEAQKIAEHFDVELCLPRLVERSCFRSNARVGKDAGMSFQILLGGAFAPPKKNRIS